MIRIEFTEVQMERRRRSANHARAGHRPLSKVPARSLPSREDAARQA